MAKKNISKDPKVDSESLDDELLPPSKTQLKQQMAELQTLGKRIAELPDKQRERIPLDDTLIEGIETYRRIKSREGKRRQMQYIGKLMRTTDLEPITEALTEIDNGQQKNNQRFHELEILRDQFLLQGDNMLPELMARFQNLDRQHLRQLLREAKKEINTNKPPTNQKKIFKYFRELSELS